MALTRTAWTIRERFQRWRQTRRIRKVVYLSADVMLGAAERRLDRVLTDAERQTLVAAYGRWLTVSDERCLGVIGENPIRQIQLFLSEWL